MSHELGHPLGLCHSKRTIRQPIPFFTNYDYNNYDL